MFDWRRFRKHKTIEVQNQNEEMLGYINESTLYVSLEHNLQQIMQEFGNSPDVKIREFAIGSPGVRAAAVFIDNLTDKTIVDDFVMRSLMIDTAKEAIKETASGKDVFEFIKNHAFVLGEVQVIKNWKGFMLSLLSGNTLILINGTNEAISGDTRGGKLRDPSEPTSQVVIRGPKDGFTENLATNVSLIRRRIKSPHLWLESKSIGSVTQTTVAIMYIQGIANDQLVQEVRQRLNGIRIDGILESGYIEELIQDQPFSPFPTIYSTERPDAVAANLLEGRIAVLVDGTPFVLVLPTTFFLYFQSVEDYYQSFYIGTAVRMLRLLSFFISLLGPSIYIASITFHQEMIPSPLLVSLAAQREGVPFPAFIEALMMETSFEILREASVRMPRTIGQAVSIVGAIVLGQAAVQAGIVSSAMVIVVSITGIASFVIPAFTMEISVRLLRFVFMFLAATLGFYGVAVCNIILVAHLCSLRSFGVPYLAPLAPYIPADQKDAVIRLPLWSFLTRPRLMNQNKITRMGKGNKPSPPKG
ncbi:spore germination protein [Paenibacillus sp. OAS669]|uniref:spore germination protein n=1 Tax=Paenibacillus sp. OAS669 TaxID=2663821 RepID=UPI001789D6FA|nr:spore germination protein [Paenibacillus sp. OAS669]MBE1445906.1 spore germination protein KA [Paenibacillus sp. OAS669]